MAICRRIFEIVLSAPMFLIRVRPNTDGWIPAAAQPNRAPRARKEAPLGVPLLDASATAGRRPGRQGRLRAMTIRWTWLVPS
ncbi:hypothetical protein GCM10023237_41720 [Streptomyces coeruleoprunus]